MLDQTLPCTSMRHKQESSHPVFIPSLLWSALDGNVRLGRFLEKSVLSFHNRLQGLFHCGAGGIELVPFFMWIYIIQLFVIRYG